MKYAIIAVIIAAIVGLLIFFVDIGLAKLDRKFIFVMLVLLVLSGVYFTIADIRRTDNEKKQQTTVQGSTLKNTEDINLKADSIIMNLNKSLDKAIVLKDNINESNDILIILEKDMKKQIEVLNKTLVQTKIFEQKVSEQLRIEKQKFSLEKAKLSILSSDVSFIESKKDTSHYSYSYWLRNIGKREAIEIRQRSFLIYMDKAERIINTWATRDLTNCDKIAGFEIKGACNFTSDLMISEPKLFELYSNMLLIIRVTYQDENDKQEIADNFFFQWRGDKETKDLAFYQIRDEYRRLAIKYIKDNNIEDILIE
jgi:hypothetical protein